MAALAAVAVMAYGGQAEAIEEPEYEVVEKNGDLELRRYAPYIVAETWVDAEFEDASNAGFERLADYIFGNNRSRTKMEMTAPVAQQAAAEKIEMTAPVAMEQQDGRYRITFVMPSEYTMETLPEPVNPEVELRQEPARLVAAVRYSGTWSQERYREHRDELEAWIDERGWSQSGEAMFARYDAPFKPWFLRRNEVLIPVEANGSERPGQDASR